MGNTELRLMTALSIDPEAPDALVQLARAIREIADGMPDDTTTVAESFGGTLATARPIVAESFEEGHEIDWRIMTTVARLANERGWNRAELAEQSGIDLDVLQRLLDANALVNTDDVARFAAAFGMDFVGFLCRVKAEPLPHRETGVAA